MIAAIRQRLADADIGLKLVAGAAQFQAATDANPVATPAAFVIRVRDAGSGSPTYGRVRQMVAASVAIVLAVQNVADPKGEAAGDDIEELRAAVRNTLLGWAPVGEYKPLEFESGALVAFRGGHLWWQDIYRYQFPISSA